MIENILINTTMPRWPLHYNRDETIQIAITSWRSRFYNSREVYIKAYRVDLQIFRRRLNRKQQPYKVAHTNQNCITICSKYAITKHYIYLVNAGFLYCQHTLQIITTIVLR